MDLTYDRVAKGWEKPLAAFLCSEKGTNLTRFLAQRKVAGATIYPPRPFYALELTALNTVRVVIVGQDPYHGAGQAQGLAFHVADGVRVPPSLRNIHKELARDLAITPPGHGELTGWAAQGVLLLNAVLTVEDGRPGSHAKQGWEALTDSLLTLVAKENEYVVFLLWGNYAQSKATLIQAANPGALILQSNHPSPLSATRPPVPFIGNAHFSKTNAWLIEHGKTPIDWSRFSAEQTEAKTPEQFSLSF